MKRYFDIIFCLALTSIAIVPFVVVFIFVGVTSEGPVIYWSNRVGRYNQLFKMPKFRTMRIGTPAVATHLLATLINT